MHFVRSFIYLSIGAVALTLLILQPSGLAMPVDAHCELADGRRVNEVYRFDPQATPVVRPSTDIGEPAPTPAVYQYYRMPVIEGAAQGAGTPTPCVITLNPNKLSTPYPATPTAEPSADEVYHLSYSGIPDLEYQVTVTPAPVPAGPGVDWNTYEVTVGDGEWNRAPAFAFDGLKQLLEFWQGFAAALILVGVLALAWPW